MAVSARSDLDAMAPAWTGGSSAAVALEANAPVLDHGVLRHHPQDEGIEKEPDAPDDRVGEAGKEGEDEGHHPCLSAVEPQPDLSRPKHPFGAVGRPRRDDPAVGFTQRLRRAHGTISRAARTSRFQCGYRVVRKRAKSVFRLSSLNRSVLLTPDASSLIVTV
jgi:hypothetical protein